MTAVGQKRTVLISPQIVRPLPKSSVYCQRLTSFSDSIALWGAAGLVLFVHLGSQADPSFWVREV